MQKSLKIILTSAVMLIFVLPASAQLFRTEEVEIKTSAQCPMCKEAIEEHLTFERGVRHALLDMETKKVTVRYSPGRTNPDRLRKAITTLGYDADEMEGDSEAYANLPACCKKPDDPDHVAH